MYENNVIHAEHRFNRTLSPENETPHKVEPSLWRRVGKAALEGATNWMIIRQLPSSSILDNRPQAELPDHTERLAQRENREVGDTISHVRILSGTAELYQFPVEKTTSQQN